MEPAIVTFEESQAVAFAQFVAELTKQGVTFKVSTIVGGWRVILLGGY
jgi:hypothetical protein